MADLIQKGRRIAYVDSAGDIVYLLAERADTPLDVVLDFGDSSNRNITLGGSAVITAPNLTVDSADIITLTTSNLDADSASITNLDAANLDADSASITNLSCDSADFNTITVDSLTVGSLTRSPSDYRAGETIEQLSAIADGRTVTLLSGSYTMDNVTAVQAGTTTYADMLGSEIDYLPPAGTKYVTYEYQFKMDTTGLSGISHYKLLVDGTEIIPAYKHYSSNYAATDWHHGSFDNTMYWVFDLTASVDSAENGKFASWPTAKTLKCQFRNYGSGYAVSIHQNVWRDGTGAAAPYNLTKPMLKITAIA